jgi:hypothetical protein
MEFPMTTRSFALTLALATLVPPAVTLAQGTDRDGTPTLTIEPATTLLSGVGARAQLIVTGRFPDRTVRDLTRAVEWSTQDARVVAAGPTGAVTAGGVDGHAVVVAHYGGTEARADVEARSTASPRPRSFRHDVLPALSKAGCNQGACHGTPTGKNGFRLSLRGYDAALDVATLTREVGTRRVNPMDPDASLILLKGTGAVPHEGGRRFTREDVTYRTLRDWVAEGLRPGPDDEATLVALDVFPADRVLDDPAKEQQIVVRARFSDGTERDVTDLSRFGSTDESVASVDGSGHVARLRRGEATVLVQFEHLVATTHLVFREPVEGLVWQDPPENNFVDTHVFAKLKLLRIPPSDLADDAAFCRRVFLDLIGLPPTPAELRAFLAEARPDKRSRLIDALMDRPEFVDHWALKWSDLLGCNQRFTGHKGAYSYHRWIRDQVAANVPLDRFVREIVTAGGSNYTTPAASFYRRTRTPEETAEGVSQLFLGVRIGCAKCHNHPQERWTQDDYYGLAAFFSQVRYKNGPQTFELYNKEETVYLEPGAQVRQPRTGVVAAPRPLGGEAADVPPGADRRAALADWIASPENPFFARAAVNRIWFHLLGRGIVDPVDDLRESNPPASAELLAALADDFARNGFDARRTIRLIANSRTYQLSSAANPFNADDARYFSHAKVRLLTAEQLLDAVSLVTERPERLFHLPPGTRAAEIPDGEFPHEFLRTFGQPPRSTACECERQSDSTLEQALQVVGGRTVHSKLVAPDNRIGRLIASKCADEALVEDLFLATLGRRPRPEELRVALDRLGPSPGDGDARRRAAEDVLWALLNHPEFLFQH